MTWTFCSSRAASNLSIKIGGHRVRHVGLGLRSPPYAHAHLHSHTRRAKGERLPQATPPTIISVTFSSDWYLWLITDTIRMIARHEPLQETSATARNQARTGRARGSVMVRLAGAATSASMLGLPCWQGW